MARSRNRRQRKAASVEGEGQVPAVEVVNVTEPVESFPQQQRPPAGHLIAFLHERGTNIINELNIMQVTIDQMRGRGDVPALLTEQLEDVVTELAGAHGELGKALGLVVRQQKLELGLVEPGS